MHRRTTVLLLSTALTALPGPLALADDGGSGQVVLPGVPERLSAQQACTAFKGRATSDAPGRAGRSASTRCGPCRRVGA